MIVILVEKTKNRSQYLSDYLKENYKNGRIHHLASIDKVKETANMLRWTKNYGLAKEINKLWQWYNDAISDDIIDYIQEYKQDSDIVLVNIDGEDNVELFQDRLKYFKVEDKVEFLFLGGVYKDYLEKTAHRLMNDMQNDTRTN